VPQFLLARKPFGLHRAYPGSYLSDRATYPHIEPPPLSFPVPYSEFGLTLEREKEIVSFNYRNTPVLSEKSLCGSLPLEILSVHIISFELQKKNRSKKNQPIGTPSPPYLLSFRFHMLPAVFVSCLALSFNFALLFECANP
jgi:hypothetical protein